MDKQQRKFEDLLLDDSFIKWVKDPDHELNLYWEQWIKHNQERRQDVALAREFLLRMRFNATLPTQEVTKATFRQIIEKVEFRGENKQWFKKSTSLLSLKFDHYLKIAAVFIILIISLGSVYMIYQQEQLYLLGKTKTAYIKKRNPSSIRSQFKLPDGTKVWLNAASKIIYPEKFGEIREVKLTGEAYFEVVRDVNRPFIVHTPLSKVKVLGTSFNVNAYEDDKKDYISLVSGKVNVCTGKRKHDFFLVPGEQLIINGEAETAETVLFDKKSVTGWTEGWLTFKNANKEEIINKLERWYDVEIKLVNEPPAQWNVNGYFRDQSLEIVLDRMSFFKEFNYKIENRDVTIAF